MTLVHIGNDVYTALAADAKPTGIPAGALVIETDTGFHYVYTGSTWLLIRANLQSLYHIKESGLAAVGNAAIGPTGLFYGGVASNGTTPSNVVDSNGHYFTKASTASNVFGLYTGTNVTARVLNPRFRGSMGFGTLGASGDARLYFGLCTTAPNSGADTPIGNGDHGVIIGARSTDTNFQIFNNDGTGAMVVADTGVAKSNCGLAHLEIIGNDSVPNFKCYINGVLKGTVTTRLPGSTNGMYCFGWTVAITTNAVTSNWAFIQLEHMSTRTSEWATGLAYSG